MATGKNGTFIINNTASSGLPMGACRFTWEETYEVSTNTSTVKITKMEMLCAGDGYGNQNYGLGNLWFNGSVDINGITVATVTRGSHFLVVPVYGAYTDAQISSPALPWQTTVEHNSDGTKSVTVTVGLHALASSGNAKTNTAISGSATLELTTIPRASTVTAPNGNIGSAVAITINRASSSFTHTLTYKFGSASGTIASKTTAASVSWTPPTSLYSQVPSATSGSCTITCDTYSGSTKIGTTTKTITLSVPASVKPTVQSGWATVSRVNGSVSVAEYIQGYSKAKVTFDPSKAAAGTGSSVKSFTITYAGKTYTASNNVAATPVLTASGIQIITATVTDQRGRTESANLTVNVQPYSAPTLSAVRVFRCDADRVQKDDGDYFYADATASCASVNGKNAITERKVRFKTVTGAYGEKADFPGRFGQILTTATYVVEISAKDTVGNTVTATVTLPTASVGMNIRIDHDGAAFGKYCEHSKALELPEDWTIRIGDHGVGSNLDILDNGWFTINQRGLTSYSGSAAYSLDRWRRSSARTIITMHDGYITHESSSTATNYAYTYQLLELSRFDGADYLTISMLFDDGYVMKATGEYNGLETNITVGYYQNTAIALFQSSDFPGYLMFRIATKYPSLSANIRAVKAEVGKVSTLANDSAPNYAAELLKCQRYYQIHSANNVADVDLRPNMRATPSKSAVTGGYAYIADL